MPTSTKEKNLGKWKINLASKQSFATFKDNLVEKDIKPKVAIHYYLLKVVFTQKRKMQIDSLSGETYILSTSSILTFV